MQTKIFLLLALIVVSVSFSYGQQSIADSLEVAIRTGEARDTNLVNALNRLSYSYLYDDAEKSGQLIKEAIAEGHRIKFDRGLAVAYNLLGIVFDITSEYDSALRYYQLSLEKSRLTGYTKIIAGAYNNIGMVYKARGDYKKSIRTYYQALNTFKDQSDPKIIANIYNNLGLVYSELKQYTLALDFHKKALAIREEISDKYGIGASLTNIGLTYAFQEENDKALSYYLKSLKIKEEIGDKYGMGILLNNLAIVYKDKKENKKALEIYKRSINVAREIGDHNTLISAYINSGMIYALLKQFDQAKVMVDSARELAVGQKALLRLARVYEAYSEIYSRSGDYKLAYESRMVYDSINDSLYSENNSKSIAEMRTRFETGQKEIEITLLQNQNRVKNLEIAQQRSQNRYQLMGGALILIFISGSLLLWQQRTKYRMNFEAEHEKAQLEKQAYTAILNAEEGERKRIAMELHDGLGQLLSAAKLNVAVLEDVADDDDKAAVNNAGLLIDQSIIDLRQISHNLMPSALIHLGLVAALNDMASKINSGRQVKVTITAFGIDQRLPENFEIALYRVVQESVNNILKHANAGNIIIRLSKTGEAIDLEISDDGRGMEKDSENKGKGIGWDDIRSRVSMFNGKMMLYSQPGEGTRLNFNFSKASL
jgi:signal transduction histidine kinase